MNCGLDPVFRQIGLERVAPVHLDDERMIGVELSGLLGRHKHLLAGERTAVERRIGPTAFRDLRQ